MSIFIILLNGLPGVGQSQPKHVKDINIYIYGLKCSVMAVWMLHM